MYTWKTTLHQSAGPGPMLRAWESGPQTFRTRWRQSCGSIVWGRSKAPAAPALLYIYILYIIYIIYILYRDRRRQRRVRASVPDAPPAFPHFRRGPVQKGIGSNAGPCMAWRGTTRRSERSLIEKQRRETPATVLRRFAAAEPSALRLTARLLRPGASHGVRVRNLNGVRFSRQCASGSLRCGEKRFVHG